MSKKLVSILLCLILALVPVMSFAEDDVQLGHILVNSLNEGRRIELSLSAELAKSIKKFLGDDAADFASKLKLKAGFQMGDTMRADVKLSLDGEDLYSKVFEIQDDAAYLWSNTYGDKVYAYKPGEVLGMADDVVDSLISMGVLRENGYGKMITQIIGMLNDNGISAAAQGAFPTSFDELNEIGESIRGSLDFSNLIGALGTLITKVKSQKLDKPVDPLRYVTAFTHAHVLPEGVKFDKLKTDKNSYVSYLLTADISKDDLISLLNALIADIKKQPTAAGYSEYLDLASGVIGGIIKNLLKSGITAEIYLTENGGFAGVNVTFDFIDSTDGTSHPFVSFMMPSVEGFPIFEAKAGLIDTNGDAIPHVEFLGYLNPEHYIFVLNVGPADNCIFELLANAEGKITDTKGKGHLDVALHVPSIFGEENTLVGSLDIKGKLSKKDFNFKTDAELSVGNAKGGNVPFVDLKLKIKTTDPVKPLDVLKNKIVNIGELSPEELSGEIEEALGNITSWIGSSFKLIPETLQKQENDSVESILSLIG